LKDFTTDNIVCTEGLLDSGRRKEKYKNHQQ
jgi:hypothetical protein